MSIMLQTKRASRGQRINALEAMEGDEEFYTQSFFAEDASEDDGSYETEEEKVDVFDSDFNESEDDGSDSDGSNNEPRQKRGKDDEVCLVF